MISQDELFEWLSYSPETGKFTWLKRPSNRVKVGDIAGTKMTLGCISISIKNQSFTGHRLAWYYMTGDIPDKEIDHINMVRDDNRWENLRIATKKQNTENRVIISSNTSGFTGVYWVGKYGKWLAKIVHNQKQYHIGYFDNKIDAARARAKAEKELFTHAPERPVL